MQKDLEVKMLLSILNAWKKDGIKYEEVPWHITDLGWLAYANHWSEEVRKAAIGNPYYGCPSRYLQQRRAEFKLDVKAFA